MMESTPSCPLPQRAPLPCSVRRLGIKTFLNLAKQDKRGQALPEPNTLWILYDANGTSSAQTPQRHRLWDTQTHTGVRILLLTLPARRGRSVFGFVQFTGRRNQQSTADVLRTTWAVLCVQAAVSQTISWRVLPQAV